MIIKNEFGSTFGGFTNLNWGNFNNGNLKDEKSFLYSIDNKLKFPNIKD